jgi:5,10-methylenetetrahydromethanopterin reductase
MRVALTILGKPEQTPNGPSIKEWAEMVQRADEYGVAQISTGEGQTQVLECFTIVTYMATLTKRVGVGPRVTNPVTRHPGVMANGLASLDLISEGRAYLGLGRGDGAVHHVGLRSATVDETREYFLAVRELLEEGETFYKGKKVLLEWPQSRTHKVPLYIVAAGPRMLKLAGAVADGVYIASGLTPKVVRGALDTIAEGAREAGRDLSALDIWWVVRFSMAESRQQVLDQGGRESLASIGNHSLRGGFEGKFVPEELQPRIREYHAGYNWEEKGRRYGANAKLMENLGLLNYFMERFGVMGSPDEVVERFRQLEKLGVQQVHAHAHNLAELKVLGERIMPAIA